MDFVINQFLALMIVAPFAVGYVIYKWVTRKGVEQ